MRLTAGPLSRHEARPVPAADGAVIVQRHQPGHGRLQRFLLCSLAAAAGRAATAPVSAQRFKAARPGAPLARRRPFFGHEGPHFGRPRASLRGPMAATRWKLGLPSQWPGARFLAQLGQAWARAAAVPSLHSPPISPHRFFLVALRLALAGQPQSPQAPLAADEARARFVHSRERTNSLARPHVHRLLAACGGRSKNRRAATRCGSPC
jgi:hypothetical protein